MFRSYLIDLSRCERKGKKEAWCDYIALVLSAVAMMWRKKERKEEEPAPPSREKSNVLQQTHFT